MEDIITKARVFVANHAQEPRRWVMEDVKDEKISHMGEVPESFER